LIFKHCSGNREHETLRNCTSQGQDIVDEKQVKSQKTIISVEKRLKIRHFENK
jgi:hypothetical protein